MKFQIGQKVRLISNPDITGIIQKAVRVHAGIQWYRIKQDSPNQTKSYPETDLQTIIEGEDLESIFKAGSFAKKSSFSKLITFTKLNNSIQNNVYSMFSSRTEFHAYQYKPLLKFLDSVDNRLLIADEVGLGKTIEAGLILIEERVRNPLDRALVVCPTSLTHKWKDELKIRFDEDFRVIKSHDFKEFCEDYEKDSTRARIRGIASLATLRSRANLDLIKAIQPNFDLIIIDEAHHLRNRSTLSHRLGLELSLAADSLILLTATPINLGNEDLFNLLRVLNQEVYDNYNIFRKQLEINHLIVEVERELTKHNADLSACNEKLIKLQYSAERQRFLTNPVYHEILEKIENVDRTNRRAMLELQHDVTALNLTSHIITRTKKREVQENICVRTANVVEHEFFPEEMELYQRVTQFVKDHSTDGFSAFLVINYQRQIASCIHAMIQKYRQTDDITEADEIDVSDFDIEDLIDSGDRQSDSNHSNIRELISSISIPDHIDSKYDSLKNALDKLDDEEKGRKIIIFSFFVGTLEYLSAKLTEDGYDTLMIHGKVDSKERYNRIDNFRKNPNKQILLSSEVGSEGLDLQFCNIIVNYDLPWNPMRVEQRIGRIDRFGQQADRVIIINLVTKNTIEEKILNRLYTRIGIFEQSIGDLEPILGEILNDLQRETLSNKLTDQEYEKQLDRIADTIVKKRIAQEELEKESGKFIGFDEYFAQELDSITKQQRFISDVELITFIKEFIETAYPQAKLIQTSTTHVYQLEVTNELLDNVRKANPQGDINYWEFNSRCAENDGVIRVTFNSEYANLNKTIEYINISHPLSKFVRSYYSRNRVKLHPCAQIQLTSNDLPPGEYFYFVFMLEFSGAKPEKRIEYLVLKRSSVEVVNEQIAEQIINVAKTRGKDVFLTGIFMQDELSHVYTTAEDYIYSFMARRKEELEKVNERRINDRIANLNNSFNYKVNKVNERLKGATNENIIRMLTGQKRKLEMRQKQQIETAEEGRAIKENLEEIAAGFIQISS